MFGFLCNLLITTDGVVIYKDILRNNPFLLVFTRESGYDNRIY
nr:MAG TPA: hypothetical protein [Caudoviricetes sp.]